VIISAFQGMNRATRSPAAILGIIEGTPRFGQNGDLQSKNSALAKVTRGRGSESVALNLPDDAGEQDEDVRTDGWSWRRPGRPRLVLIVGNRPVRRSVARKRARSMDLTITDASLSRYTFSCKVLCDVAAILREPAFGVVMLLQRENVVLTATRLCHPVAFK
jgi:hypothetical protein